MGEIFRLEMTQRIVTFFPFLLIFLIISGVIDIDTTHNQIMLWLLKDAWDASIKALKTMVALAATVRPSAVSHDIWLFTNDRLMAECSLSNSDLAFYHEWPSIFNSGQDPKTQHIFSHQDTVHLTTMWIKAIVPSHHTDQQVNMQLLTQQGRGEKAEGRKKKKN